MNYSDIIPTHNSLRNPDSFNYFCGNIKAITESDRPPLLLKMEDGKLYLNDGHHRLTAAYAVNVPFKHLTFNVMDMTYTKMMEVNWDIGWLTPYDPRFQVRRNDCLRFKTMIKDFVADGKEANAKVTKAMAEWIMFNMTLLFLEPRQSCSLKDLIPNGPHSAK